MGWTFWDYFLTSLIYKQWVPMADIVLKVSNIDSLVFFSKHIPGTADLTKKLVIAF